MNYSVKKSQFKIKLSIKLGTFADQWPLPLTNLKTKSAIIEG